jgi:hypothetical protein
LPADCPTPSQQRFIQYFGLKTNFFHPFPHLKIPV